MFDIVSVSKSAGGTGLGIKVEWQGGSMQGLVRCPLDAEVRAAMRTV